MAKVEARERMILKLEMFIKKFGTKNKRFGDFSF